MRKIVTYGQGRPEGNEVTLENSNANGQDQVISFVDAAILRCNRDAVSRVLYFPDNLPQEPWTMTQYNYVVPEEVSISGAPGALLLSRSEESIQENPAAQTAIRDWRP